MKEKPQSPSTVLGAKVLFETLRILENGGGVMRRQAVIKKLEEEVKFTDWENAEAGKSGQVRWHAALWWTTDAVSAGFMTKQRGEWAITPEGRLRAPICSLSLLYLT